MLTFQDYPINFRSIYRKELERVRPLEDLLNLIDDLDNSYFVKIIDGRNIGNKVDIQKDGKVYTSYITNENTNRWHVYLSQSWDRMNVEKKNSKIVRTYENSNALTERYKLFLDIYKSNCISVLEGSEIPSFLSENKVNIVKVISWPNYGKDDDWRQYKSNFLEIEFVHSKNLQSYKLKVPKMMETNTESVFKNHRYWQINIENDDVVDIIRSDEDTYNIYSERAIELIKGQNQD